MGNGKDILIFAELAGQAVHKVSYELIGKARELAAAGGVRVECLVLGPEGLALEELCYRGADRVYYMAGPELAVMEEGLYKANVAAFIREHSPATVLIGATNFGRSLAPRVAAALRTGLTADCIDLQLDDEGRLIQIRPAFSDNILAHIKTAASPQMATIRYKEFAEAASDPARPVDIRRVPAYQSENPAVEVVDVFCESDFDISAAEVVVAGGRGIRRREDLDMLQDMANLLGGALGVSRALVDAGMLGSAHQVGYSGNRVKPRLYVACGISGAPQHLAGMKEAETIIAVNSDPSAPIFKVCDYGYVGDLYEVVPKLMADIKAGRGELGA